MKNSIDEKVVLTLFVPSIEDTVAWYENVLGWSGHFDVWDKQGKALFSSVSYRQKPFVGFNISRRPPTVERSGVKCDHIQAWIYVKDVDAVYRRVSQHSYDRNL